MHIRTCEYTVSELYIIIYYLLSSIISIQIWLRRSKKTKQILYESSGGKLNGKMMKRETQVTKISIMIIASFVILYLPNFLVEILDPTWKLPGLHVAAYIICWCWVFVNPGVYVFGCAYFRSAFKITYGLRLGSNDMTYASNSSKMRRNISCGTLTRGGSIANDRSIIVNSPAIVRSQSIVRSPIAISLELQGPKVKSPSTISF